MPTVNTLKRISFRTREGYDKQSWIEEATRHFRSAQILRRIRQPLPESLANASHKEQVQHVLTMEAAVHSSVLLMSYSIELLLKAGLTSVYFGCSKRLFEREVKARFGHDLVAIAEEIEYPLSQPTRLLLKKLQKIVVGEGRYPFLSLDTQRDIARRNERARRFWSERQFQELLTLHASILSYVSSLDRDSDNPVSFFSAGIDDDGYFAFRCGGNLAPRIIVKYSSAQRKLRQNNKRSLRQLILMQRSLPLVHRYWHTAKYRYVKC